MNDLVSLHLSSDYLEIIAKRERKLIPSYVLEETINLHYIQDKNSFKEQFSLASYIYSKVKREAKDERGINESYIQHPLRMLKKLNELGFRNENLSRIVYGHDTIEILRDYSHLFNNYSNLQRKVKKKYEEIYSHIQLLTPLENSALTKTMQLEKLIQDSSSLSSIEISFIPFFLPVKIKVPIKLPLPLTVISKIIDVYDNCYDQKKVKPEGITSKLEQIELLRNFIEKNPTPFEQLSQNISLKFSGFPSNTIPILYALLDNAENNLYK